VSRQLCFELAFALCAIVLGLYLLIGSQDISLGTGYDKIGPRFFPYLIAAGLLGSAGLMIFESLNRKIKISQASFEIIPFFTLIAGLILSVLLLEYLGFILSVTILFVLVARAFKSSRPLRDLVVGLLLCIIVYFVFTSGLGLVLPRGLLSGLI
jgi:putative tricarboxylic transport membrane protein